MVAAEFFLYYESETPYFYAWNHFRFFLNDEMNKNVDTFLLHNWFYWNLENKIGKFSKYVNMSKITIVL